MELKKNSKTWKNLETAFAGESQAHMKYQYFASQAKKTASSRSLRFSPKPQGTKKSMLRCGTSS